MLWVLKRNKLPVISKFPVFQRLGEMSVQIRRLKTATLALTVELNEDIQKFHRHLFDELLRLGRGGVEFAPEHSPFPLLIVPLKRENELEDYVLDYACLKAVIRGVPQIPTDEVRRKFKFQAKFP